MPAGAVPEAFAVAVGLAVGTKRGIVFAVWTAEALADGALEAAVVVVAVGGGTSAVTVGAGG